MDSSSEKPAPNAPRDTTVKRQPENHKAEKSPSVDPQPENNKTENISSVDDQVEKYKSDRSLSVYYHLETSDSNESDSFLPINREITDPPYQFGSVFTAYYHTSPKLSPECKTEGYPDTSRYTEHPYPEHSARTTGTDSHLASIDLHVEKLIRTGKGYRAQLLAVSLCGSSGDYQYLQWELPSKTLLAAKIFDPYHFAKRKSRYQRAVRSMARMYSTECQAYKILTEFQGSSIPKYYGSYYLSLPLSDQSAKEQARTVYMVLMQYIDGQPLCDISPDQVNRLIRQQIVHRIIEIETMIFQRGIRLDDLAGRNIMVVGLLTSNPQIAFVDFADVLVISLQDKSQSPLEIQPDSDFEDEWSSTTIERWDSPVEGVGEWVDWEWRPWLKRLFGSTCSETTISFLESEGYETSY